MRKKTLTIIIAAVFLTTNSAFAYSPHGTFRSDAFPRAAQSLLHIQDVHLNSEAQKNIGRLIEDLLAKGQIDLIALEGTFGAVDLKVFRNFPERDAAREAVDFLFKEGELSGPLAALLTTRHPLPPVVGIDDETHYNANIAAYLQSRSNVSERKKDLESKERELQRNKERVFNSDLATFDREVARYRKKQTGFADYLNALCNQEVASKEKVIDQFLMVWALEKSINIKNIQDERRRLLERLPTTPDLIKASLAFRQKTTSEPEFYRVVIELAKAKRVDLSRAPALLNYIRYVEEAAAIDGEALLNAAQRLERHIYAELAKTEEERALVAESRRLYLIGKLIDFALTRDEWEEYRYLQSVSPGPLVSRSPGHDDKETWGQGDGGKRFKSFEAFYEEAETRDRLMTENLMKAIKKHNAKRVVLVTGGFHTKGIKQFVHGSQGTGHGHKTMNHEPCPMNAFQYSTFTPRITKLDTENGSSYLSVFAQEKTPLEKLFQGEKLFVPPSPIRGLITLPFLYVNGVLRRFPKRDPQTVLRAAAAPVAAFVRVSARMRERWVGLSIWNKKAGEFGQLLTAYKTDGGIARMIRPKIKISRRHHVRTFLKTYRLELTALAPTAASIIGVLLGVDRDVIVGASVALAAAIFTANDQNDPLHINGIRLEGLEKFGNERIQAEASANGEQLKLHRGGRILNLRKVEIDSEEFLVIGNRTYRIEPAHRINLHALLFEDPLINIYGNDALIQFFGLSMEEIMDRRAQAGTSASGISRSGVLFQADPRFLVLAADPVHADALEQAGHFFDDATTEKDGTLTLHYLAVLAQSRRSTQRSWREVLNDQNIFTHQLMRFAASPQDPAIMPTLQTIMNLCPLLSVSPSPAQPSDAMVVVRLPNKAPFSFMGMVTQTRALVRAYPRTHFFITTASGLENVKERFIHMLGQDVYETNPLTLMMESSSENWGPFEARYGAKELLLTPTGETFLENRLRTAERIREQLPVASPLNIIVFDGNAVVDDVSLENISRSARASLVGARVNGLDAAARRTISSLIEQNGYSALTPDRLANHNATKASWERILELQGKPCAVIDDKGIARKEFHGAQTALDILTTLYAYDGSFVLIKAGVMLEAGPIVATEHPVQRAAVLLSANSRIQSLNTPADYVRLWHESTIAESDSVQTNVSKEETVTIDVKQGPSILRNVRFTGNGNILIAGPVHLENCSIHVEGQLTLSPQVVLKNTQLNVQNDFHIRRNVNVYGGSLYISGSRNIPAYTVIVDSHIEGPVNFHGGGGFVLGVDFSPGVLTEGSSGALLEVLDVYTNEIVTQIDTPESHFLVRSVVQMPPALGEESAVHVEETHADETAWNDFILNIFGGRKMAAVVNAALDDVPYASVLGMTIRDAVEAIYQAMHPKILKAIPLSNDLPGYGLGRNWEEAKDRTDARTMDYRTQRSRDPAVDHPWHPSDTAPPPLPVDLSKAVVVILAGGQSARFFPFVKVFLDLTNSGWTLLQQSYLRVSQWFSEGPYARFLGSAQIYVLTVEKLKAHTTRLLTNDMWGRAEKILSQPTTDKGTLGALLWAMAHVKDPETVISNLNADHLMDNDAEGIAVFRDNMAKAIAAVQDGTAPRVVMFNLSPPGQPSPLSIPSQNPADWTGFGAIQFDRASFDRRTGAYRVARFEEKPTKERAAEMIKEGNWVWNSGMFVGKVSTFEALVRTHQPEAFRIYEQMKKDVLARRKKSAANRFNELPAKIPNPLNPAAQMDFSLDAVVIPETVRGNSEILFMPVRFSIWDVGSWTALEKVRPKDKDGNLVMGNTAGIRARHLRNSIVYADRSWTEEPSAEIVVEGTATAPLENLIIVHSVDGKVLIIPKEHNQKVKMVAEAAQKTENIDRGIVDMECTDCIFTPRPGGLIAAYGLKGFEISQNGARVTIRRRQDTNPVPWGDAPVLSHDPSLDRLTPTPQIQGVSEVDGRPEWTKNVGAYIKSWLRIMGFKSALSKLNVRRMRKLKTQA